MRDLKFLVYQDTLTPIGKMECTSNSVKYPVCRFDGVSCCDWTDRHITAHFSRGSVSVAADVQYGACLIPYEVLVDMDDPVILLSLRGVDPADSRLPTNKVAITVIPGCDGSGLVPTDPSPNVYDVLRADVDNLDTRVDALEQSGGGGASITSLSLLGTTLTITMTDSTSESIDLAPIFGTRNFVYYQDGSTSGDTGSVLQSGASITITGGVTATQSGNTLTIGG